MSQNKKKLDFEIIPLETLESPGEQPPTIRKMFRGQENIKKLVFVNSNIWPKHDFERK
jgi:hypothetical protein